MTDDAITTLLQLKIRMEKEIAEIRDTIAIKNKALVSVMDTITMLQGYDLRDVDIIKPHSKITRSEDGPFTEPVAPVAKVNNVYDDTKIKGGLEDFFTSIGQGSIRAICEYLHKANIIPSFNQGVRAKVWSVMRNTMPEVEKVGDHPTKIYYRLRALDGRVREGEDNGQSQAV